MERYYQKEIECASREQIRTWQDERLVRQVRHVWDNVPYYRAKMEAAHVAPDDIKGRDDLYKLPFLSKADLREAYPFGLLAEPLEKCIRIHSTSGTTGKPIVVGYNAHDMDLWADCIMRLVQMAGVVPGDRAQMAFGYGMFTGGFGLHYGLQKLGCMMIPGIINTVPLYTLMIRIKAVNTLWGMALVCATLALPQAVFVFSGFIQSIPKELEEAAIIDGCSYFTAFWRVVFPLLKPSVAAVVILNGFGIWNNYSQAVFFLQSSEKHNVPQALSVYFQQFAGAQWNLMAATAVIAIIPVVAVFLVFQKRIMSGLTEGAIKG